MKHFSKGVILTVLVSVVLLGLVGCATTEQTKPAVTQEAAYELYGYRYVYKAEGKSLTFNYIDYLSNDEVKALADHFMGLLPAKSYDVALPGQLNFTLKSSLTEAKFNEFVDSANGYIRSTF